jgi:hypothetical protein
MTRLFSRSTYAAARAFRVAPPPGSDVDRAVSLRAAASVRVLRPDSSVCVVTTSYPADAGDPAGHFVKATIVQAVPFNGYTPPASYEYQTHLYIIEWSAPSHLAPLMMASDVFFGNGLLTLDEAAVVVLRAIKERKDRALSALGLDDTEHSVQMFLTEKEERLRKLNPSHTGGRMADG